jgi:hypothetical protein
MSVQTEEQYRKAFKCKKGESDAQCKERMERMLAQRKKEGKVK